LKKRRRNIIIDNKNYTEFLAYDDNAFSLDNITIMIKDIITTKEYNIENYNKLLEQNKVLCKQVDELKEHLDTQTTNVEKLEAELQKYSRTMSIEEADMDKKRKAIGDITKSTYMLYAFKCSEFRFIYAMARMGEFDKKIAYHQASYPNGHIVHQVKVKYPFIEKLMTFLMKLRLYNLGNNLVEGSEEDVKCIIDICVKLEEIFIKTDIFHIQERLCTFDESFETLMSTEAEVPHIKKSKRPIDQIDKDSGKIIATFPSLEEAGRSLNVSGVAVGVAVRNFSLCKGFIFRYSGISREEQYKDQPVIKIRCCDGEKTHFPNIALAAADCKVSPPGLRNRIITHVHREGFHWVFDNAATHYTLNTT
jgi:hypothetical protein